MEIKGLVIFEDACEPAASGSRRDVEALAQVANRPIAHHVVDRLLQVGADEVIVASSVRLRDQVRSSFDADDGADRRLTFVERRAPVDLTGALKMAAPLIGGACCIAHVGSGLLGEPLAPLVSSLSCETPDLTVVAQQNDSVECGLVDEAGSELSQPPSRSLDSRLNASGLCLLGPNAVQHVSEAVARFGSDIDLALLAQQISSAGGGIQTLPGTSWCRYAGDPLDLLELNRAVLDQVEGDEHPQISGGNRIAGRVRIDREAVVGKSMIIGPAVIGPGARIHDTYIGPYTSIGAGANVVGAEIENSIVSSGATIMHVGTRLTASVVGRDARIFRDFSLPRALRLSVGDGTEIALC